MRLIKKKRQDKEEEEKNLFQCNLEDLNYEINRKIRRKRLIFFYSNF